MCIALTVIVLYLIYVFVAASRIVEIASHPRANSYDDEIKVLKSFGYDCTKFLEKYPCRDFVCKSDYGYDIHGRIFKCEGSDKAVLLCHGHGGNSTTMLSYADIFMKLGYSVVVYDHRNFGINEKSFTSFGYYESKDLVKVFNHVKKLFGKNTKWGLMGESMGGATVMMGLPDIKGLSFSIVDCGYSDMKSEIKIKDPLPSLGSLELSNLFFKKRYGYTMNMVRPSERLKLVDENLPMLFIYSKTDKVVPFRMFDTIYSSKKGNKSSWIIENCRHAKAIFFHTKEYEKHVRAFLGELR